MFRHAILVTTLPVLTFTLHAQTTLSSGEIIALTHLTPTVTSQQMDPTRKCPGSRCTPSLFEKRQALWAGGTGYDGRRHGVWISNGSLIALVDPDTCQYICKPQKAPFPVPQVVNRPLHVTGLALVESGAGVSSPGMAGPAWLFMSDSYDNVSLLQPSQSCQMKPKSCSWAKILNPQPSLNPRRIGGLATDDKRRLLYMGTSVFGVGGPANVIYVARLSNWCTPICKFTVTACNSTTRLGPITGLAYDSCQDILYVTDGRWTVYGRSVNCQFKVIGCCPALGEQYTGLAVRPKRIGSVGRSCTKRPCNSCPSMVHTTVGDPVIGNPTFAFQLKNASGNYAAAVLGIGIGPCNPVGFNVGFCATIKISPVPPILVFFGPSPVSTPCGGKITFHVPIPNNYSLCGLRVSSQFVIACKSPLTPPGNGVTNCLSMQLSGT